MAEVGVSGVGLFTEVNNQQQFPFALKDSNGKTVSGVIPLNSRPVLGDGGFEVTLRHPFHTGSGRFSVLPEGSYGLGWGPYYSTMFWSLGADAALNFGNGGTRLIAKAGYGGYKVEVSNLPSATRHGAKVALELATRLFESNFDLSAQFGTTLTPDGPQTTFGLGLRWLFDKRPQPPVDLDGSLGRQAIAFAEQILDQLEAAATIPQIMTEAAAGTSASLYDRLSALSQMVSFFADGTNHLALFDVFNKLDKAKKALDHANDTGLRFLEFISPVSKRVERFKENRLTEIFQHLAGILDEVQAKQCNKAAAYLEDGDTDAAKNSVETCAGNLTTLQTLFTKLTPLLTPARQIDASTAQRKVLCLLKTQECTNDIDPQKTVPEMQKRLKPEASAQPGEDKTPPARADKPAPSKKVR